MTSIGFNKGAESITQAEHISPDKTGDNIDAKRVANYVWDGSNWQRNDGGSIAYDLQVDDTGTYTYLGNAAPGTATSAAAWRIKRVTNATGVITHADGDSSFNKTWTARATYSY